MNSEILRTRIDAVGPAAAVLQAAGRLASNARPALCIVQANVHTLVTAEEDPAYERALGAAGLVVPDGMPLVWILRWRGHKNVGRVYGPDLMLMMCKRGAKEGWRCYLYGGRPGVPELLKQRLVTRFPGLNVVGTYSPPFRALSPEEDSAACEAINAVKPDILGVGLGGPKQDLWMYQHREKLDVSVMHGVGAAFDFLSGRIPQAPRWMMNVGLEWFFRLLVEPRRLWKRYTLTNVKFVYYLIMKELFHR